MNCQLNNVQNVELTSTNMIGHVEDSWDTVLLGDMFYDEAFANSVAEWVHVLHTSGKTVFIGDPGRLCFIHHKLKDKLTNVLTVNLPEVCQWENNGLTQGFVWKYPGM